MAGKITVSTINDSSGVLATQNGMTGIAKAWLQYNGSTQSIAGSFNVSSVTYNSTGSYTVNFTTAFANANYSAVCSGDPLIAGFSAPVTTVSATTASNCTIQNVGYNGSIRNPNYVMLAVFGT